MDFDLDDLVNLEQKFYDEGFKEGYDHGRIHGMIEGRALGRQKGYEIWEELGFYEGFALCWSSLLDAKVSGANNSTREKEVPGTSHNTNTSRVQDQISSLLSLISKFPTQNPTSTPSSLETEETSNEDSLDLTRQLSQIRSKYKLLCSLIGIKPRPIPAPSSTLLDAAGSAPTSTPALGEGEQEIRIESSNGLSVEIEGGSMNQNVNEGRRERGAKKDVWALHGKAGAQDKRNPPLTPGSLSF